MTRALGEALGMGVDAAALQAAVGVAPPELVEWSVNGEGDARGRLRVSSWTADLAAAARARAPHTSSALETQLSALPAEGMDGLGFAFSSGGSRARWYRLPPLGCGGALAESVAQAFPQLAAPAERLARALGGRGQCQGFGVELEGGSPRRATLYYRLKGPRPLLELLRDLDLPASPRARLLVEGLMGVSQATPRPWPKAWIARSVGPGGGWKLYIFARRDPHRLPDEALLDAVEADAPLRAARERLMTLCPPEPAKGQTPGVVQLLGLRLDAEPAPRWTVYLAPR